MKCKYVLPGKEIEATGLQIGDFEYFGSHPVYILDQVKYRFCLSVKKFTELMNINRRTFRTYLTGKRLYFPRKYIAIHSDEQWEDNGKIVMLKGVKVTSLGKTEDMIPFTSILNILSAYMIARNNEDLKIHQIRVAGMASDLYGGVNKVIVQLTKNLEIKEKEEKGVPASIDLAFEQVFDDEIFQVEYPLLRETLEAAYPDRPEWKYKALIVCVFKYAYEDILGKYAYEMLKKKRKFLAPLHQHVNDPITRQKLKVYITAFSALMYYMEDCGDNALSRLTKTKNVRQVTQLALTGHDILAVDKK